MKAKLFFFGVVVCALIIATTVQATYFDTGWVEFKQPNGVTFVARMWGDEWNYTFETKDAYPFDKNFSDGYYYYALSQIDGAYSLSNLKVGINMPVNIPKQLEVQIKKPVGLMKSSVDKVTLPQLETWTLKVIMVEFQDIHGNTDWERSDFSKMLFSSGSYISPNDTTPSGEAVFGSLRDYYDAMSNGDLIITGQILNDSLPGGDTPNWIRLSHNKNWYRNHSYWNL